MFYTKLIPFVSESEIRGNSSLHIQNAVIREIYVSVVGHFGNAVCLNVVVDMQDGCSCNFIGGYNLTRDVGFFIQTLFAVMDISDDSGISLDFLKNKPLRIIENGDKIVGFGNFLKDDKFVFLDKLLEILKVCGSREN